MRYTTKPKSLVAIRVFILGAAVAIVGIPETPGQSQVKAPQEVRVVNSGSQPIPILAQGTTTVAGTVTVAGGSILGINPDANIVRINSNEAAPIFVRMVESVRTPYHEFKGLSQSHGNSVGVIAFDTVPTGKRLVIEHVSLFGSLQPGQSLSQLRFRTTLNNSQIVHALVVFPQPAGFNGNSSFAMSQAVKFFADPGSQPTIIVERNDDVGLALFSATVSGYLMDLASPPQ